MDDEKLVAPARRAPTHRLDRLAAEQDGPRFLGLRPVALDVGQPGALGAPPGARAGADASPFVLLERGDQPLDGPAPGAPGRADRFLALGDLGAGLGPDLRAPRVDR